MNQNTILEEEKEINISENKNIKKESIEKIKIADKLITMKINDIHNYNEIKSMILDKSNKKRA